MLSHLLEAGSHCHQRGDNKTYLKHRLTLYKARSSVNSDLHYTTMSARGVARRCESGRISAAGRVRGVCGPHLDLRVAISFLSARLHGRPLCRFYRSICAQRGPWQVSDVATCELAFAKEEVLQTSYQAHRVMLAC